MSELSALGDLGRKAEEAKEARRKRANIPASRVGARTTPVVLPERPQHSQVPAGAPTQPFDVPQSQATSTGALAPATISLDRKTEEVLEAVRTAGRFAQPKVDANRSATIRLAVVRLAEQLSPEEIAAELRQRAPLGTGTGRRRL